MSDQRGIGLIEVVITVLVVTTGILATLAAFVEFGEASYEAQRRAAMASIAQKEIERIRALPYAKIGLSGPVDPTAGTVAPLPVAFREEPLVSGGVVRPGGEAFDLDGIEGRIFRYVTWRAQGCPLLKTKLAGQLSGSWGQSVDAIVAALSDLCPGTQHTKRVTIVMRTDRTDDVGPVEPIELSSVISDPAGKLDVAGTAGLNVDPGPILQAVTGPPPATTYETIAPQQWHLYDTPCTSSTRQAPSGDHASHDTAAASAGCAGPPAHDLMGEGAIPGAIGDALLDLSTDVHRPLAGALAMRQDTVAGDCAQQVSYADGDAVRRGAIHTWATPAATQPFRTAASNGRATLTFWTQTASGQARAGRLCMTLRRSDTGAVLGSALHALPAWPTDPTQLAVAFDVAAADMPAGTRLLLTLRNPSDGESDLIVLYDHPAYQSSLSMTMASGAKLQ